MVRTRLVTAHKKTLIRQAGSAEAFIDSLPLVVNYFNYSPNMAIFQYELTQNLQNRSPKKLKTPAFVNSGGGRQQRILQDKRRSCLYYRISNRTFRLL